jgi:transcriptional regulator with XRE-family HTH domain
MSQERLAELLGVTFQQVQKYEKGVNRIAASRLFDISAALDMSVARFFDGIAVAKGKGAAGEHENAIQDVLATPEGMQLVTLFASVKSYKVRRRVVELVRSLTDE